MRLFNKYDIFSFVEAQNRYVQNEIEKLSNEDVCGCDVDELEEYFYGKYKIELLEVEREMEYIQYDAQETTLQQYNHFYRNDGFEPQYYNVNGYKIIYKIPFDGDSDLLQVKPSSFMLSSFDVDNIIKPTNDKVGQIIFSQNYETNIIDQQENMIEFITREFDSKFASHFQMIDNINSDAENKYNKLLKCHIRKHLDKRIKKAEKFLVLREKLNIPLKFSNMAPNIRPVRLKKVKKEKLDTFPKLKSAPVEYAISDDDYNNIKNIINLSCISMEKTARTFTKLQEEELRDVILASLNTHYVGTATGETFNKRGKTDIHIPFDNKSAYIGECKIWTGQGAFTKAIIQLFSYMRWRDTKTSLIFFNKKNKDFPNILDTIDEVLKNNELCIRKIRINNNEWQCDFKKDKESAEIVKVNVVIYDLHVEL